MTRSRLVLLAGAFVALVLAPGCVSHQPLASDIARAGAAWHGPPLPLVVGVGEVRLAKDVEPAYLADMTRRSLLNVLSRSGMLAGVRFADDRVHVDGAPELDLVLTCDVLDYELYTNYSWVALYGGFLIAPVPGTAIGAILIFFAGFPVFTDCGVLSLEVEARDARTGESVGRYRTDLDLVQASSIYGGPEVTTSILSHPEIVMQQACARIAQQIGQDRFWLLRKK